MHVFKGPRWVPFLVGGYCMHVVEGPRWVPFLAGGECVRVTPVGSCAASGLRALALYNVGLTLQCFGAHFACGAGLAISQLGGGAGSG
jgi:hypothetical protein